MRSPASSEDAPAKGTQSEELTFRITVLPLEGADTDRLAERQLAVILRLLRRAADARADCASAAASHNQGG